MARGYTGHMVPIRLHEALRMGYGYGRVITRTEISDVMAITPGLVLPEGTRTEDFLDRLQERELIKRIGDDYLLVRSDERKEPIVGFNPYKKS